nr:unnamed protein product [Callosobruchus chinensis]
MIYYPWSQVHWHPMDSKTVPLEGTTSVSKMNLFFLATQNFMHSRKIDRKKTTII